MGDKEYKVHAVKDKSGGVTYVDMNGKPKQRGGLVAALGLFCIGVVIGALLVLTLKEVL